MTFSTVHWSGRVRQLKGDEQRTSPARFRSRENANLDGNHAIQASSANPRCGHCGQARHTYQRRAFCARVPAQAGRSHAGVVSAAGRAIHGRVPDVRKHHTLLEICKRPDLAAEVTITAAEKLKRGCGDHLCRPAAAASSRWAWTSNSRRARDRWFISRCGPRGCEVRLRTDRPSIWDTWRSDQQASSRTSRTDSGLSDSAGRLLRWPAT